MTYEKLKSEQGGFIQGVLNFFWISAVIIGIGVIIYEIVK